MPWKNGGGETREIALGYAKMGTKKSPDWRVSIATIAQSGWFSSFIDMDRTIVLLKGDDVVLTINDCDKVTLFEAGECFSFQGEAKVYATITGGASIDLNIMTNRHYYHHYMQRLDKPLPALDVNKIIKLVLIALSSLNVTIGHEQITLAAFDALILDNGNILPNIPYNKQLIVIAIMDKL